MWFNDKINNDNTIHFDGNEWECTDPDQGQFCRKVNDTTFEYIQLKDMDGREHSKHLLETLNDRTHIADWYQDEIDVTDYNDEQVAEYLAPYGGIMDGCTDPVERNQLIAECIFETDAIYE